MRIWEGVWWCLGALALFLGGWRFSSDAEVLESVPRINQMSELAKLLEFRRIPLVVGVSGTVCCENPIHCEFGGLRGVVVMQTASQRFLKRDEKGDWQTGYTLLLSECREVPWYLDDGTGRVNVVGATGASGFTFPASSGQFEQSRRCHECEMNRLECETKRSVECERIDDREGIKLLGVQRTERVLPIGISLSVVGEAVKDDVGTIRIQKPHEGPFYVSTKSIDELIASHKNWARFLKCASFGVAVIGLTLIAAELDKYIRERLRRSEWLRSRRRAVGADDIRYRENNIASYERAAAAVADIRSRINNIASYERAAAAVADIRSRQHNAGSSDTRAIAAVYIRSQRDNAGERAAAAPDGANSCVICLEHQYNVVFIPCGHMCCCTTCCSQLTECPLCRQPFSQAVRTFRP
ncbi:hypothetical protein D8674_004977 [Pyrus ussuriensis x Pyrus communis]|uniref:RING-type E3 ubiquitin transferase n=1 Tax=Pyrus ussuriensis x Pyrus communis TaxID=2448454 RepID=A0A5N5FV49_9ROSA|nr:hypothetical protein D8674_004977 [Pyrus ussuriensis x Pyrus communis]